MRQNSGTLVVNTRFLPAKLTREDGAHPQKTTQDSQYWEEEGASSTKVS